MKKLSLLLGTLGGAMAGYVFSNSKLRDELSGAKDAEAAGKILAKHLAKDGKQLGHEVKKFAESDEVQANLKKAKEYASTTMKKFQGELKGMVAEGTKKIEKEVKKASKEVKKAAKKTSK